MSGIEIERADAHLQKGPPIVEPREGDHPEVAAAIYALNTGVCRDYYGDLLDHSNGITDLFSKPPTKSPQDVTR